MLQIHQLSKAYGERVLFDDVTVSLTPGERLGLVGRNGSGKTTLLRLILGEETPDSGRIDRPRGYTIGHLSQHIAFEADTVLGEACLGLPIQDGGWVEQHKAEQALMGLGFSVADFDRPPGEFSGGFQVRLQLAKVLVSAPNLLLLDEPTNYLDIVSMRWLERYLRAWDGEVILITHDRQFMDAVTTHTMVIHRGKVRRVAGGTAKLYEMLAVEEEIHEKTRQNQARSRKQTERFIERFRYKASKARQVQSRVRQLEKQKSLEQLEDISTLDFKFNAAPFAAHSMVRIEDLTFGYGDGPALIEHLTMEVEKGARIAIIGKNGKGKSTLLNLIAGELVARAGTIKAHPKLQLAHFGQTNIDRLHHGLTVEDEILSVVPDRNRGTARGICGLMMFQGDEALKKVEVLSGGERARVLLGKLLVTPANLVLLDEPTNHLDMESIEALIEALQEFDGGAVVVTHNERVLHAVATKLVVFDRGAVSVFDGTYRDFLDRIGWSDEDVEGRNKTASRSDGNGEPDAAPARRARGKAARQRRAAIHAARAAALKPLQRRIETAEGRVIELEERLEGVDTALARAAEQQDADAIARLSTESKALRESIDAAFATLEQATAELMRKGDEFDRQLEEIDG